MVGSLSVFMRHKSSSSLKRVSTKYRLGSTKTYSLKEGKLVQMFERRDLEGRHPLQIAQALVSAFEEHCTKAETAAI